MKQAFSILLILLLAVSWYASYFTLQLIDRVIIEHKLSVEEQQFSKAITQDLGIRENIQLKKIDLEEKLKLGYAAPFVIAYETTYFEIVDNPVIVTVEKNILQLKNISHAEQRDVMNIISNIFKIFVFNDLQLEITNAYAVISALKTPYIHSAYSNVLSLVTPPPRV